MTTLALTAARLLIATAALACVPASAHERVRAQQSAEQCPLAGPDDRPWLRVFDTAAQWRALAPTDRRDRFGRAVQWSRERVLVFALPRQPTLGVQVEFDARRVELRGGALRVPVQVRRPGPDELAGTALSRPCVMAVVARDGWRTAVAIDSKGRVLARSRVSAAAPSGAASATPDLSDLVRPAAPAASR